MTQFNVELAKNNEQTLKINNHYIYSKYSPKRDAFSFIENEINLNADGYILVGLGLGYHLECLVDLTVKPIVLILLDNKEIEVLNKHNPSHSNLLNKVLLFKPELKESIVNYQILIPPSFARAIGDEHPLHDFLQDILIKQRSYRKFSPILEENFKLNTLLNDCSINEYNNKYAGKVACLISSGPSLDTMLKELTGVQDKVYILCVGSALKALLRNGIKPDAVIVSDGQDYIQVQLSDTNYDGILFYLSTANHQAVIQHRAKRVIILQNGYNYAELFAKQNQYDLLDTGGSVATVGLSLLEYLGFGKVFLIGQDFGFGDNKTHSNLSTSGRLVTDKRHLRRILSNNGNEIFTTENLYTYLRWFNAKIKLSKMRVYNTAENGAMIENVPYIDKEKFHKLMLCENL